jgi:hypothetical protein
MPPRPPVSEAGKHFDPRTAGTITGTVRWAGARPDVRPFHALDEPLVDLAGSLARDRPNPNAPRIDPDSQGLASAVVFLRGVDPRKGRPWDHEPARVELRDWQLQVRQGKGGGRLVGFVRAGEAFELVSRQERPCNVQGRGAAFFSLGLTRPGQPRSRRLEAPGVVELMSGTGQFWMRAYLFVSEHPYLTLPDERGRFRVERVPPGEYDLVAWHPDWRVVEEQRNPDLFRLQQVRFGPRHEVVQRVRVEPGQTAGCELVLQAQAAAEQ